MTDIPPIPTVAPVAPATPIVQMSDYKRDANGKFAKGTGGRKPGIPNRITRQRTKDLETLWPDALAQLKNRIAEGDMAAVQLVIRSLLPQRGRSINLGVPLSPDVIREALSDGTIAPAEAAAMAQTMKTLSEVEDVRQLTERLETLEQALKRA